MVPMHQHPHEQAGLLIEGRMELVRSATSPASASRATCSSSRPTPRTARGRSTGRSRRSTSSAPFGRTTRRSSTSTSGRPDLTPRRTDGIPACTTTEHPAAAHRSACAARIRLRGRPDRAHPGARRDRRRRGAVRHGALRQPGVHAVAHVPDDRQGRAPLLRPGTTTG